VCNILQSIQIKEIAWHYCSKKEDPDFLVNSWIDEFIGMYLTLLTLSISKPISYRVGVWWLTYYIRYLLIDDSKNIELSRFCFLLAE